MADGAFTAPTTKVHADGVYLDLPMADYVADRALSGSAFKALLSNPADWAWEHVSNPMWDEPESDARRLGTVVHKATLEGIDAFDRTYCIAPNKADHPDAIDTSDDLKRALGELGLPVSFKRKDEGIARLLEANPRAKIWDAFVEGHANGRQVISAKIDRYVRIVERFVRNDPAFKRLLNDGLAEVSIFWTDGDGVRFKARPDYFNFGFVTDLKKFGQPPRRGRTLSQHVIGEVVNYSYDLQAVHNMRAIAEMRDMVLKRRGEVVGVGEGTSARLKLLEDICAYWFSDKPPEFRWLFVRCPGAPTAIAPAFRPSDAQWGYAEHAVENAIAEFKRWRAACGDELWLRSEGLTEIDDLTDWPMWAGDVAR